jgi:hypothetical protein
MIRIALERIRFEPPGVILSLARRRGCRASVATGESAPETAALRSTTSAF